MFKPVPMVKLTIMLLDKHLNALTSALGEAGFVHLTGATTESGAGLLTKVNRDVEIRARDAELSPCRHLREKLDIPHAASFPNDQEPLPPDAEAKLAEADSAVSRELAAIELLTNEATVLKNRLKHLALFPIREIPFADLRNPKHLYIGVGTLPAQACAEAIRQLGALALVRLAASRTEGTVPVVAVAVRLNRFQVESILKKAGFVPTEIPAEIAGTAGEETAAAENRLRQVEQQIEGRQADIRKLADGYGSLIVRKFNLLKGRLCELHAQEQFGQARRVHCVTGWIPADREADARRIAAEITENGAVVTSTPASRDRRVKAGQDKVPVKFTANVLLQPFQALVSNYGIPRYEEVEPSLFVAITFVLMFGIMFGDAGQGAVLALAGLYFLFSRRPRIRAMRPVGTLLLFCGLSASFFGLCYGSLFGREVLPALWLRPMEETTTLFVYAIGFGIVCISIALIFNLINSFRAGEYMKGFLDKCGLAGALFYWGVLGLGLKTVLGGRVSTPEIVILALVPLALLFLREPLHYFLERRHGHATDGFSVVMMTAFIETADTLSSFFSNTVSFVRVGAFALSHAALCMAVYAISDILREAPGGRWLSPAAVIGGNLFVIGMEGMLVLIQITRLQYYELFAKYFRGDGIAYAPFQLEPRTIQGEHRP